MLVFLEEAPCVLWAFGKIIPYFITNNHWKLYSNGKYWSVVLYNFVFILWDLIYTFKVSCLLYVLFLFVSFLSLTMIFLSGEENLHNRSICKTVLLGESWSQKVPLEHVTESLPQPIFFFFPHGLLWHSKPRSSPLAWPLLSEGHIRCYWLSQLPPGPRGWEQTSGDRARGHPWAIPGPCEAGAA